MGTRPFFSTLTLLVAVAVLATACASGSSMTRSTRRNPKPYSNEMRRWIAAHEAGHAIIRVAYFGKDAVVSIHVHPFEDDSVGHDEIGSVVSQPVIFTRPSMVRRVMVSSSAGIIADRLVAGSNRSGSQLYDMLYVRDLAWRLFTTAEWQPRGIAVNRDSPPPAVRKKVEAEIKAAQQCAEKMILANKGVVAKVANLILAQPIVDFLQTVPMEDFRALMTRYPPVRVCDPHPRGWPP